MEKIIQKKDKLLIYLLAFFVPFAMVQIFYALCGIWPYGDSSILTGDMDLEFVNFYAYFINIFHSKNDFSYMLAKTLGGDFPGLAAFQLHDPLLFILFLFQGDRIAAGIELLFALQVSIAGLNAAILLNERYKRSYISLVFSTGYAFCSFFFGYLVLTIYFGCLALLPLVICFFLDYLEGRRGWIPYVLSVTLFIYINYHMGFMLVIFLCIFYVTRVINNGDILRKWKGFVCTGIMVLMLDGFFLIRTGLSLIGEKTTEGADYGLYRNFAMNQLFAGFFSGSSRNELMPLIYCSVAGAFFAVVYFLSDKYPVREKLANLLLLMVLFASMWINAIDAVWHGFNNPEGFYWRYAYYVSITVAVLGYKGIISLTDTEREDYRKQKNVLISVFLIGMYMVWLIVTRNAYFDRERQIVNAIIVAGISVSAVLCSKGGKNCLLGLILLACISAPDMLYNAKVSYIKMNADDGVLPSMSKFRDDYHRVDEAVSYIKSKDGGFYRIEKDFDRTVNDPAMFDYIGLSHDSSCEKDAINHYLTNYGFRETIYYTFYNGGSTSFADAVLGVKYFIAGQGDTEKPYDYMGEEGGYGIYENAYALPMAYIAPDKMTDFTFDEENTFEKQNHLAAVWETGTNDGANPLYIRAESGYRLDGAEEDAPGHFVRTDDEGFIVYNVHITEDNMPLYLYFSAPAMQSGEVFVNGDSLGWYFTENHWNVLNAGTFSKGEDVEIRMQILKDELTISEACFYYEDSDALETWSGRAGNLNDRIGAVSEIASSHLKFDTDTENGEMVVISIPYDTAWKVYCDGKRIESVPAVEMLMGLKLPRGHHEIEMKYIPHGTIPGFIVSLAGVVLFVGAVVRQRIGEGDS